MSRRYGTIVDATHWLTDDGQIPPDGRVRSLAIRMAQCIEYGASLPAGEIRETLIPCRRRYDGLACDGMLVVFKEDDDSIDSSCDACLAPEFLIRNWQHTRWAKGPPRGEPYHDWAERQFPEPGLRRDPERPPEPPPPTPTTPKLTLVPAPGAAPEPGHPLTAAQRAVQRILGQLDSPLSLTDVAAIIATAPSPAVVLNQVLSTARRPAKAVIETFLNALFELWNETPRPELGGLTPNAMHASAPARQPARAEPKAGRNAPCPCGSGKKYKRCCGQPSVQH